MSTYTIDKIEYSSDTYVLQDSGALQLTGGQVPGPVTFGDTVTIDDASVGSLVVTGNASFTNNINANTINGVTVGNSPKFTDTTYSSLAAASGGTAVSLVTTGEKYTWNSKTSNTGTVTSIGISNATNGGLSVSGSPVTTSGSITVGHSNVLTSAQTTQAVYPIKIDKNGHISAYGNAVTIPTKVSDLTNDSGFVTTDEKVSISLASPDVTYYPILGSGTTAANRQYDTGLSFVNTLVDSNLTIGNEEIAGLITLYNYDGYNTIICVEQNQTEETIISLPGSSGTLALTSDIPDVSGKIDTAGTGLSKSGTTLNHSNSITAQTTSAVYPIKIDAQGHISEYDSAVTIPTNTNQLTNGAGFITSPNIPYCTCATDAATIAKVATVVSGTFTADNMVTGAQIIVKFTNSNSKSDATLKVGNTTVKTIKRYGTTSTSTSASTSWQAGSCILFIYDGTYWQMAGWLNSTYSEASVAEITSSSSSTARLISGRRANSAVKAFESITDVTMGGISVVNNRVAEIPDNSDMIVSVIGTYSEDTVSYTADYTFEEIQSAIEEGLTVVCCYYEYYPDEYNYETEELGVYNAQRDLYYLESYRVGEDVYDIYDGIVFTSVLPGSDGYIEGGSIVFYTDDNIEHSYVSVNNTDTKLITNAVQSQTTNYLIMGSNTQEASTKRIDATGLSYSNYTGTTSAVGYATLTLGNSTAQGTSGNKQGIIELYGSTAYKHILKGAPTAERILTLPDKTGTIALTSDIPTVPTITLNGSSTTSPSFYAPTTAGTSGYYLKSNGSGAPTWATIPAGVTVTLNGSTTTTPSFYAPTEAGTSGQYLKSNGSGAPSWTNFPTIPSITLNGSANTSPSFYAPTTAGTSGYVLQSNGSGAPTWTSAVLTDKRLEVESLTGSTAYFPILATGTGTAIRQIDSTFNAFKYIPTAGTTSTVGTVKLILGNSIPSGTANNERGVLKLYGTASYHTELVSGSLTGIRTITLPDKTGTVALTSDIPENEIFICEYNVTSYADVKDAYDDGYVILCHYTESSGITVDNYLPLISFCDFGNDEYEFVFRNATHKETEDVILLSDGTWGINNFSATSSPSSNANANFDSTAHMNSTDMSSSDISTFIAGLNTSVGDYVQLSDLEPVVSVPTFNVTTGTLVEAQLVISGRICHLCIGVKNSAAVAVGGNIFAGTIDTRYAPKQLSNGVGYYTSTCGIIQILDTGAINVRCTGAQLAANSTIYCSLTYIY